MPVNVPGVVDEPEQAVVAGIEALLVVAEELSAELHRVPAAEPGQLLVDLIGLGQRVRVGGDRARER